MYKDYIIIDVNWSYGMNTTKASSEIIIIFTPFHIYTFAHLKRRFS